jgi:hypothetical protein
MLAAAVVAGLVAAAVVAPVPREAVVPVRARLVRARLVRARPLLARPLVPADPQPLREPAVPLLAQPPVREDLVLEPAVPVELLLSLLSRQSFSAAMALSSPQPGKPQ